MGAATNSKGKMSYDRPRVWYSTLKVVVIPRGDYLRVENLLGDVDGNWYTEVTLNPQSHVRKQDLTSEDGRHSLLIGEWITRITRGLSLGISITFVALFNFFLIEISLTLFLFLGIVGLAGGGGSYFVRFFLFLWFCYLFALFCKLCMYFYFKYI